MPEKDITKFMIGFIKLFGEFLEKIAEVEQETNVSTSDMEKFSNPEELFEFFQDTPPEKLGTFMKFIFEAMPYLSKFDNPIILSSDEKIKLSQEINELLDKYSSLNENN